MGSHRTWPTIELQSACVDVKGTVWQQSPAVPVPKGMTKELAKVVMMVIAEFG